MRGNTLRIVLVLLSACAFVCAAEPGVWLDVPFVKQERDGCGAASVAMVMQFWQRQQGLPADANAAGIQRALYSTRAHGIYASDLARYFQEHNYRTFAFEGRQEDLRHHLAKGRPLIAALKPGARQPLHYVVVVGLDAEHGLVLLNDPGERKLLQREIGMFEGEWKGTGHWTLLAVPQSEGASSAQ